MYMPYVSSVVFVTIGRPGPMLHNNLYIYIYKIVNNVSRINLQLNFRARRTYKKKKKKYSHKIGENARESDRIALLQSCARSAERRGSRRGMRASREMRNTEGREIDEGKFILRVDPRYVPRYGNQYLPIRMIVSKCNALMQYIM